MDTRSSNFRNGALVSFFLSGVVGLFADMDHILCSIENSELWSPEVNSYGCRLWHDYYLYTGWIIVGIIVALLVGFIFRLVGNSFRSGSKNN